MDMRNLHSILWVSVAILSWVAPAEFRHSLRRRFNMNKIRGAVALAIGLILVPHGRPRIPGGAGASSDVLASPSSGSRRAEQEIVSLEREAARAILLGNGTFFQRVYSDDFEARSRTGSGSTGTSGLRRFNLPR